MAGVLGLVSMLLGDSKVSLVDSKATSALLEKGRLFSLGLWVNKGSSTESESESNITTNILSVPTKPK